MRRNKIQKALQSRARHTVCVHIFERQRIPGNHNHQHQQHRHHEFRHLFNAAFHAVINNQRRRRHKQKRKHDRRNRRGDKAHKIAVLRRGSGLPGHIDERIFCNPAADDRVVGHDQHRHEEGQNAEELPLRVHFSVCTDGAFLRPAPDGNVRSEKGKAEGQHQRQIDDQEKSAAVLCRQIRKAPEIADADRASRRRQHKAELPGKIVGFLFHDICSPCSQFPEYFLGAQGLRYHKTFWK